MTTLIKQAVPHSKPAFNQLYLKSIRPLAVYIKHSHKVLTKCDTLIIHAMTAAINKAVQLFVYLKKQYPYLLHTITTDSVPTILESDGKHLLKERSAIHIVLTKDIFKKQEQKAKKGVIEAPHKRKSQNKDEVDKGTYQGKGKQKQKKEMSKKEGDTILKKGDTS